MLITILDTVLLTAQITHRVMHIQLEMLPLGYVFTNV